MTNQEEANVEVKEMRTSGRPLIICMFLFCIGFNLALSFYVLQQYKHKLWRWITEQWSSVGALDLHFSEECLLWSIIHLSAWLFLRDRLNVYLEDPIKRKNNNSNKARFVELFPHLLVSVFHGASNYKYLSINIYSLQWLCFTAVCISQLYRRRVEYIIINSFMGITMAFAVNADYALVGYLLLFWGIPISLVYINIFSRLRAI